MDGTAFIFQRLMSEKRVREEVGSSFIAAGSLSRHVFFPSVEHPLLFLRWFFFSEESEGQQSWKYTARTLY
jgi:hypothetical protein